MARCPSDADVGFTALYRGAMMASKSMPFVTSSMPSLSAISLCKVDVDTDYLAFFIIFIRLECGVGCHDQCAVRAAYICGRFIRIFAFGVVAYVVFDDVVDGAIGFGPGESRVDFILLSSALSFEMQIAYSSSATCSSSIPLSLFFATKVLLQARCRDDAVNFSPRLSAITASSLFFIALGL